MTTRTRARFVALQEITVSPHGVGTLALVDRLARAGCSPALAVDVIATMHEAGEVAYDHGALVLTRKGREAAGVATPAKARAGR